MHTTNTQTRMTGSANAVGMFAHGKWQIDASWVSVGEGWED